MIVKGELHQNCDFVLVCPLCTLGNFRFACFYVIGCLFQLFYLSKNNRNTIRVSNSLDPNSLQKLSADDTRM